MRGLVTTTSFQDTPGAHHDVLAARAVALVIRSCAGRRTDPACC